MPHEDSDEVVEGQVIDEVEVEYKEEECDTDARGIIKAWVKVVLRVYE